MTFRELNRRFLAPGAQTLMIFGIVALCQPWSEFLHRYGLTLTLIGLVAFLVTSKIAPEPQHKSDLADGDTPDRHDGKPDDDHRNTGIV